MSSAALDRLSEFAAAVAPADADAERAASERLATLAVPPGALGAVADLAVRLAASRGRFPAPPPASARLLIFAGDHGVHDRAVTPWPQALTATLATTLANGHGAAAVMAKAANVEVRVIDVGLATDPAPADHLVERRVRPGTRDLAGEDAMTVDEVAAAVEAGADTAVAALDDGCDAIALGDVGLANTTSSAALIAALTGEDAARVTGRGSGIDDQMLRHKRDVVATALRRHLGEHGPNADAWTVLASLGGLEHAAMVGAMLVAASRRVPVVLDGVVSNAAALVAARACPAVTDHLVAAHRSTEPAAGVALDALGLIPLLTLDLRVGEGTGALLAWPLLAQATAVLQDTATLGDLGVAP